MNRQIEKLEAELARLKHPLTANDLVHALEQRHTGDVFISECKDGPTHTASHRRLDAWVLKRTWSPVTTIGYEIKIHRSDWLSDKKVTDYLPLCHYLNVVAPRGIVSIDELPAGIGLLEPAGTGDGQRLLTRKKAVWRDIQLPGDLLVYVLMCRVKVERENHDLPGWRERTLRYWVEDKADKRTLSSAVNKKIKELFDAQEKRMRDQMYELQQLAHVRKRIEELGFDPEQPVNVWRVEERIKEMAGAVDGQTIALLERAEQALKSAREALEGI